MQDVSKAILVGRVGVKPSIAYTQSGVAVLKISLATKVKTSAKESETTWHNVTVFSKYAEALAPHIDKGTPLYVEGVFFSRKYQDKSGVDRVAFEVRADQVVILESKFKPDQPKSAYQDQGIDPAKIKTPLPQAQLFDEDIPF